MAVYEMICKNSDFIIHSSCNDSVTCQDKNCKHNNLEKDREYWLNHTKYIRPLLQSSDAHSLEQIGKKYSWLKADTNFEGLKQIKYEPRYRISLEKVKPNLDKDEVVIDRIQYRNMELFLSENLNTIIGGRSTGKSTLLNSIAKKLGNDIKKGHAFEDIDQFKIFWKDGKEIDSRQVQYIPQEYMYTLAQEEEKFTELIDDIIKLKKEDLPTKNYKERYNIIKKDIQDLLFKYKEKLRKIEDLVKPEYEKKSTQERIKNYKKKKSDLLNLIDLKKVDIKSFDQIDSKLKTLETNLEIKKNDLKLVDNLSISELELNNTNFNEELSPELSIKINDWIKHINEDIQNRFKNCIDDAKKEWEKSIDKSENELSTIKSQEKFKKYEQYKNGNKELSDIDNKIKTEEKLLEEIEKYESDSSRLEQEKLNIENALKNKYKEFSKLRENITNSFFICEDTLEISIDFVLKDLDFEFEYINGRGNSKENFIEKVRTDIDSVVSEIFDDKSIKFKSGKGILEHIEYFFTTEIYSYKYKVKYQGDSFEQMSPGKKAFVVLKLILEFSESNIPVLIDQPEDSLDNRAIYNELTTYIKATKLKRQIIVVTHNPNIVVSGDSENIIIANQHSNDSKNKNDIRFDYINGAIESYLESKDENFILYSKDIRDHVCEILEGGEKAFLLRENKYAIAK